MRRNARIGVTVAVLLAVGLTAAHGAETTEARVAAGIKAAGLAAAGPKPFVEIVCPLMQQQAEERGLRPCPSSG
ncbi:hypothetical protein AUC71_12820 [Methyloceanibacter marginalis]|uniref:Uncharacterized protein n=1 Tax=Methyloceanibacter marginalis TaxID=1774971 RepID=A0A1E3WAP4_9HYPH|nr:hypothetical protein [Methyloceanibacter marginalis]ODS02883.1 hypothetical protein AUC71_12820 [Methyloceanibacter marginalis]